MKEVKVDEEFIVAVFWNDEEDQRSKEELADRHFKSHVKTPRHVRGHDLSTVKHLDHRSPSLLGPYWNREGSKQRSFETEIIALLIKIVPALITLCFFSHSLPSNTRLAISLFSFPNTN